MPSVIPFYKILPSLVRGLCPLLSPAAFAPFRIREAEVSRIHGPAGRVTATGGWRILHLVEFFPAFTWRKAGEHGVGEVVVGELFHARVEEQLRVQSLGDDA